MGAAAKPEATSVGLSGGLAHPLVGFGAKGLAVCSCDAGEEWHQAGKGGVRTRRLHRAAGRADQISCSDAISADQWAAGSNARA